jgi:NhaP-type Na+/H+ or K+/H+ antiporter
MESHLVFLTLGTLFLLGLLADQLGRRTRLPRVTLLLLCGVAVGSSGLNWLPVEAQYWYEFLTIASLTTVAFLLGSSLSLKNLRKHGVTILAISLSVVIVTIAVVGAGLWAIGVDLGLALLSDNVRLRSRLGSLRLCLDKSKAFLRHFQQHA